MKRFEITLPHLPYRQLSQNARLHWAVKRKWTVSARNEACIEAMSVLSRGKWEMPTKATIYYEFTVKDNRRRDVENLIAACKAHVDGIVDAGVITDDRWEVLTFGGAMVTKGESEQTKLIIVRKVI